MVAKVVSSFWHGLSRHALSTAKGTVAGVALVLLLNAFVVCAPTTRIRGALAEAVKSGFMQPVNYSWGDVLRSNEQFTDAALLGSLICDDRPWLQRMAGSRLLVPVGENRLNPGVDLFHYLEGRIQPDPSASNSRVDRYWNGARLYPVLALQFLSLKWAKGVLLAASFLAPVGLAWYARRASPSVKLAASWVALASWVLGPPLFYGASFSFGLAFLYSMAAGVLVLRCLEKVGAQGELPQLGALCGLLGALGWFFDLLNGAAWFTAWLIFFFVPLDRAGRPNGRPWFSLLYAEGSFLVGAVAAVLVKYGLVAIATGTFSMADFWGAGAYRLGLGQQITLSTVGSRLREAARWIGFGNPTLGTFLFHGTYLASGLALLVAITTAAVRRTRQSGFMLAWTFLAVLGTNAWFLVMRNHTTVHAWFLVNWLFLAAAAAGVSLCLGLRSGRSLSVGPAG